MGRSLSSEEKKLLWRQCRSFLQFIHVFLSLLIFTAIIVAICGGTWLYLMKEVGLYNDIESNIGLWESCINLYQYGIPSETCENLGSDVPDYLQSTRVFMIMATLPALIAFIGGIVMIFSDRTKGEVSAICHFITATFTMIGMAVYTGKVNEATKYDEFSYGWSFIVGWLSFIMALLAGIIAIMFGQPKLPKIQLIVKFQE